MRRVVRAGSLLRPVALLGAAALMASCQRDRGAGAGDATREGGAGARRIAVVGNLENPESARWDPAARVWFVSNVNGSPTAKDDNGYITRLRADGTVDSLKFIAGGRGGVSLSAPKGIALVGDTLWVTDIDAVRAFDKRTGAPVATVDLAGRAKFLNDAAPGPDGVYVTDTGADRVFRIGPGHQASIALESKRLAGPNGIAWDSTTRSFVIVPFGGRTVVRWRPGEQTVDAIGRGPAQQDGVEVTGPDRLLITAWSDSSLFRLDGGKATRVVGRLPSPADIGVDPERRLVAVPLLMENRVEIWELP